MSLRELCWACDGRRHFLGGLVGFELSYLTGLVGGKAPEPETLNPYPGSAPPEKPKTEAQRERETKFGWQLMDRFFVGPPKKES